MAARKNRPVMYEVVRRNRRRESGWWRRTPPPTDRPEERSEPQTPSSSEPAPNAARAPASNPARETAPASFMFTSGPESPTSRGGAEPPQPVGLRPIRINEGRVRLDLGWPGLVVAAVLLIFVGWVIFDAGRRTTPEPPAGGVAADDPFADFAGNPVGDLEGGERLVNQEELEAEGPPRALTERQPERDAQAEGPPPPAPAPNFKLQGGHTYLVIQHFRKSRREDALRALKYLLEHGIKAVVLEGADYQLLAADSFLLNQKDPGAAAAAKSRLAELKRKVKELGKEYAREGGGYAFEQAYERTYKQN